MKRKRQCHRNTLFGQLFHPWHKTHRAHSDISGRHAKSSRAFSDHPTHGSDHSLVVRHRLAHTHEHNVRQPSRPARNHSAFHSGSSINHLINDFARRHITL